MAGRYSIITAANLIFTLHFLNLSGMSVGQLDFYTLSYLSVIDIIISKKQTHILHKEVLIPSESSAGAWS